MFTAGLAETVQDVVTLNGVEPGMISGLLDYAYTGQITITKHNVQSMLSAANLLEILPVRDACCQVIITCCQKLFLFNEFTPRQDYKLLSFRSYAP